MQNFARDKQSSTIIPTVWANKKKTLKNGQASMKQQRHGEQTARDKQAGPEWGDGLGTRSSKRQAEANTKNASKLAFNIKLGRGGEP